MTLIFVIVDVTKDWSGGCVSYVRISSFFKV